MSVRLSGLAWLALVCHLFHCTGPASHGQVKDEKQIDREIYEFLSRTAQRLSHEHLATAYTFAKWQTNRPKRQWEYRYMLGLEPMPKKTPINVNITKTFEEDGVIVENIHFQSRPGLYVTGNLYRPKGSDQKLPAVLYVCGHSNRGREGSKSRYQDHPHWFARNGYICLIIDTLQLGEIPGIHHGTYGRPFNHFAAYDLKERVKPEVRWWWHSRGYTPAGVECWNGIRAIDYLVSRDDVDASRIGVTGISGGGAATLWIAAADERVKVAIPVSGMSDLKSYVNDKVINGHCDCMFLYNTYQWDWTEIAALVAPRPMLFANSDNDSIFPMDGNRRIERKLGEIYRLYGKEKLFAAYVSEGGHAYREDLRLAIFRFMNEHLKGDKKSQVKDIDFESIDPQKLRVFPTLADLPKDCQNEDIDQTFVAKGSLEISPAKDFSAWKKKVIGEIKEKCFGNLAFSFADAKWLDQDEMSNHQRILVDGCVTIKMIPRKKANLAGAHALVVNLPTSQPNGDWKLVDWPSSVSVNGRVSMVFPRHGWSLKSPPNYVERAHVLLGTTVAAEQVRDIIVAWKLLQKKDRPTVLVGAGKSGILAAYAALLEPSISEIKLHDIPSTHQNGPHLLNIQRICDVPESLGLLAPRKLTLVNVEDVLFDRVLAIYRAAGAEKHLSRK